MAKTTKVMSNTILNEDEITLLLACIDSSDQDNSSNVDIMNDYLNFMGELC